MSLENRTFEEQNLDRSLTVYIHQDNLASIAFSTHISIATIDCTNIIKPITVKVKDFEKFLIGLEKAVIVFFAKQEAKGDFASVINEAVSFSGSSSGKSYYIHLKDEISGNKYTWSNRKLFSKFISSATSALLTTLCLGIEVELAVRCLFEKYKSTPQELFTSLDRWKDHKGLHLLTEFLSTEAPFKSKLCFDNCTRLILHNHQFLTLLFKIWFSIS